MLLQYMLFCIVTLRYVVYTFVMKTGMQTFLINQKIKHTAQLLSFYDVVVSLYRKHGCQLDPWWGSSKNRE